MNTIRITATPNQVITWLDHAAKSSARAITASKLEKIKSAHREELDAIEQTMRELREGGIQTDLDKKK